MRFLAIQGRYLAFLLIGLISTGPFGLAWYYAHHPELVKKTSNYGTLIVPPYSLDYTELVAHPLGREKLLNINEIKGRWALLQLTFDKCETDCIQTLHKTHQLRLSLNKDTVRVQRMWITSLESPPSDAVLHTLLQQDKDVLVVGVSQSFREALLAPLFHSPHVKDNYVLLMDPLGNLVLWYESGFDPYKLVKDLKHVLKASQIG